MLFGFVGGAVIVRQMMPNWKAALGAAEEKLRAEVERGRLAEMTKADLEVALTDRVRELGQRDEAIKIISGLLTSSGEELQKSAASIALLQERDKRLGRELAMQTNENEELRRKRKFMAECLQLLSTAALK
jgi:hypothetical protein